MGAYAPDEVVAQVRALALTGRSQSYISRETKVPLTTVHRWLKEWKELEPEQSREMVSAEHRIGRLLDTIVTGELEFIADGLVPTPNLRDLMVSWGISRSKIHERAQRSQPTTNNIAILLVRADQLSQLSNAEQPGPVREIEPRTTIELSRNSGEIKDAKHDMSSAQEPGATQDSDTA